MLANYYLTFVKDAPEIIHGAIHHIHRTLFSQMAAHSTKFIRQVGVVRLGALHTDFGLEYRKESVNIVADVLCPLEYPNFHTIHEKVSSKSDVSRLPNGKLFHHIASPYRHAASYASTTIAKRMF